MRPLPHPFGGNECGDTQASLPATNEAAALKYFDAFVLLLVSPEHSRKYDVSVIPNTSWDSLMTIAYGVRVYDGIAIESASKFQSQPAHNATADGVAEGMLLAVIIESVEGGDRDLGVSHVACGDFLVPEPIADTNV